MKNAELEELNRIHYEVTADQNLKIQDLKALNAELLEALKQCVDDYSELLDIVMSSNETHLEDWLSDRTHIDPKLDRRFQSAIVKAEGKQIKSL